jgi:hypothetical protein
MKSKLVALGMAAHIMGMVDMRDPYHPKNKKERPPTATPPVPKPQGIMFEFDGFSCYALNRKNAERKYKNFLKSIK